MTTPQIVTLCIMFILVTIGYFGAAYKINYEKYGVSGLLYVLLNTAIALLTIILLGITLEDKAELKEKVKNKCPEYEKIENVYKLKQ